MHERLIAAECFIVTARAAQHDSCHVRYQSRVVSAFQDASFDVVTCQFGLFLMPEHMKALREAARVLRPGGLVAVTVFGGEQQMSKVSGP